MTVAEYRVVFYEPNPVVGARFPVGVIIRDGDSVCTVPSPIAPSERYIGGRAQLRTFEFMVAKMARLVGFELLPVFGPFALMSERLEMPEGVNEPVEWVRGVMGWSDLRLRDGL